MKRLILAVIFTLLLIPLNIVHAQDDSNFFYIEYDGQTLSADVCRFESTGLRDGALVMNPVVLQFKDEKAAKSAFKEATTSLLDDISAFTGAPMNNQTEVRLSHARR